jgi:methylenetetrahydrofolate dehydrogenase (NADP+)/methenyltetrahydrofolate cyclohydrolase
VAALGKQEFIGANFVKDGAVVVDVGISRTETGLKGDVNYKEVEPKASWITPVPGGVGPMTVAMLLQNTLVNAEKTVR